MYYQRGNSAAAEKHYIEAAGMEEDNLKKAYYTKLASIKLDGKDYPKAREYARSALAVNSSNGMSYLIIGNAYAHQRLAAMISRPVLFTGWQLTTL